MHGDPYMAGGVHGGACMAGGVHGDGVGRA